MAEGLTTVDGQPVDLDAAEAEFEAALAAPSADEPQYPAPPGIGPVDPEAPYGRTVDGKPKKGPGGRPPRDKPRVTAKAIEPPGKPSGGSKDSGGKAGTAGSYAKGLEEFLGGLALGLAVIPVPNDAVRVHCRYQSAVLEKTGDGLAKGLGMCAEHNSMVRWGVEKLTQGGGAWVLPAAMAIAPFAVSTAMLWKTGVTEQMVAGADKIEADAMARLRAEMGLDEDEQAEPAAA